MPHLGRRAIGARAEALQRAWANRRAGCLLSDILLFFVSGLLLSWGCPYFFTDLGLDPGWNEALVHATDHGLIFGKDIIFTFGPYYQIYTYKVSNNLDVFILGRLIYGAAWGAALVSVSGFSKRVYGWLSLVVLALTTNMVADALFYVLLIIALLNSARPEQLKSWRDTLLFCCMYAGIIVGAFAKLSFGAASSATTLLLIYQYFSHQPSQGKRLRSTCFLLFVFGTPVLLWLLAKQPLSALYSFIAGPNQDIVFGFSKAMSISDQSGHWQIAVFAGLLAINGWFIGTTSRGLQLQRRSTAALLIGTTLIGFIIYKASFVRHDAHAATAAFFLTGIAAVYYSYNLRVDTHSHAKSATSILTMLLGLTIASQYSTNITSTRSRLGEYIEATFNNGMIFARLLSPTRTRAIVHSQLQKARSDRLKNLHKEVETFPIIPKESTVDIFPHDISEIMVNGLKYQPRPVIQSYSSYSQRLQDINARHFAGPRKPDYVIVRAQSIDNRPLPDLDYPALSTIARQYALIGKGSKGSIVLKTSPAATQQDRPNQKTQNNKIVQKLRFDRFNRKGKSPWISVPSAIPNGSLLSVSIQPKAASRIIAALFKPPEYKLEVDFDDGSRSDYRIIPKVSRSIPFYPLIRDNASLETFFRIKQGQSISANKLGPKPTRIRLIGQAIDKAEVTITRED
jgi:hypothetical protein